MVAFYAPEAISERAEQILLEAERPVISDLVEVEVFSAIARKERTKELCAPDCAWIRAQFVAHLEGDYFDLRPVDRVAFRLAREWLAQTQVPLRSLDALHLAIAALNGLTIATGDRQLATAAHSLGVRHRLVEMEETSPTKHRLGSRRAKKTQR